MPVLTGKNNMFISYKKIFFYLYFLFIIFGCILFVFLIIFLYKNIYKTIIQSEQILILRKEVVMEDVDIDKFNEITEKIDEKTSKRTLDININF